MVSIDTDNFLRGIKYSAVFELAMFIIFLPFYFLFFAEQKLNPFIVFFLFSAGILLIISGCIGPGRYQQDFKIFIFSPKVAASFNDIIPVSAVTIGDITEGNVFVNHKKVGKIKFKNNIGQIEIKRDDVEDYTLNRLWIEAGIETSNKVDFTFFDYEEEMSLDEIDEYKTYDDNMKISTLEEYLLKFREKMSDSTNSVSLGILSFALIVILFGFLMERIFIQSI